MQRMNYMNLGLIALPLGLWILLRVLGFDGMVGQDSYAYVDASRSIQSGLFNEIDSLYVGWPKGYPLLGALLRQIGIPIPLALQLVSCLSLSFGLIFVAKILLLISPSRSVRNLFLYLVLFGVFAPYFIRGAMLTMSDELAACLCIMSLYYTLDFKQTPSLISFVAALATIFMAVFVRYPAAVVVGPIGIMLGLAWWKASKSWYHLLALLAPLVILFLHLNLETEALGFLHHKGLGSWHVKHFIQSTFDLQFGLQVYTWPNIIAVFYPWMHYGFMLFGVLFLITGLYTTTEIHGAYYICAVLYLLYALFLAGFHIQNARHLILVYPLVLILCFDGFDHIVNRMGASALGNLVFFMMLTAQITLVALSFRTIFHRNLLEQEIAQKLQEFDVPQGAFLYGFDMDVAVASRGVSIPGKNLWIKEYDYFESGSLVLFNEVNLRQQWSGKNPMINWEKLNKKYRLEELVEFKDHWKLYRIE